ncbi:hypothetical protein EIN_085600 [Entamoeba invadens IP1]|uniref:hypothetical protein n=1 Tax=Entamoeba invadens IP1 TaxID=370355 RepID=UPI0002C3D8F3|nr:hypothetical protein EIN_085600 [Entamoeba invadens IP1]ELP85318.1 hypothetical protein EIN_085600 [Entamoeba invadens IP1]|eukprot:XP_004184664.1 hypothetical protein EIN_085600 [Entamoeba invadens IP1]
MECTGPKLEECSKCQNGTFKDNKSGFCTKAVGCIDYSDNTGCHSCQEHFILNGSYCVYQCNGCEDGFCSISYCSKCTKWIKASDDNGDCFNVSGTKVALITIGILIIVVIVVATGCIALMYALKFRKPKTQIYKEVV